MDRMYTDQAILLNAVAANGVSVPQNFVSFRDVELQLATTGFTGVIKIVGSNADVAPDFSSSASAANPWSYLQTIDQIDGSAIAGGTGISYTTDTSVKNIEANTNAFKWIGVILSSVSGGSITVKAKGVSGI